MARIKFETGQVVNFEGNPTPQDIEEVANKLGINKPAKQPEKEKGFIEKVAGVGEFLGVKPAGEYIASKIFPMTKEAKALQLPERQQLQKEITPSSKKVIGSILTTGLMASPLGLPKTLLGKVALGGVTGYGFDIGQKLQEEKAFLDTIAPNWGTAIGAGIPLAGAGVNKIKNAFKAQAPRIINSLIKPLQKDLSYGKNPGRVIAEEGIIANDFDELLTKITEKKTEFGNKIGSIVKNNPDKILDLTDIVKPIEDAIKQAQKAPRVNQELIKRLNDTLSDILGEATIKTGQKVFTRQLRNINPEQTFEIKQIISDITKFTGNASDDGIVNKALKQVYGGIKARLNTALPQLIKLNEKYADLSSAKIATQYRDKILERQALVQFAPALRGFGTALFSIMANPEAIVPAVLIGVSEYTLEKVISSPALLTRLASWLAKTPVQQQNMIYQQIPALKNVVSKVFIQQGSRF